jgi:tetratricopeptide (TPR) repeat protein
MDFHSTHPATDQDTLLSPRFRPDVLGEPEHRRQRLTIEAALFGGSPTDAISVGRFRLLQRLGAGGMGTVYAAFDERLDRKIAVKLIRPSRLEGAEVRERTLREARALARVSHPNVVHVYEVGEIEEQLFVAMEFLAGPTLRAWLDAAPRPWREVLQIFRQAGEGLSAAHAQGIIHRDFKPHNAMLGADGRVRVLDFGLARVGEFEAGRTDGSIQLGDAALTMTGTLLGTPAYMAPEHLKTRQVSVLSDQFSFCVALFEALYGHRPFAGETITELMENLGAGRVTARPRDTDVPRWVHAVLMRGLAVEPDSRWPSMQELLLALARDPRVRRRRATAGTLLVAFAGALSFTLMRPSEAPAEPEVCADARGQITETWGAARAANVEQAVRTKHGARADEVLAIVLPMINCYADEWSDMRDAACRIHAEGQQSANVFDLRTACLDQRLASLDALVEILATADAQQLPEVSRAAAGLPAIERCADTAALLAAIAPPEDSSMRARVQGHRKTLARAKVHEDSGQFERGLELVTEVLADQEATSYEPLVAEAYLYKGCIETWINPPEAMRSLSHALWTGLATGHAFVAARASSKRAQIAMVLDQEQQATNDLAMITALNRRVIDDPVAYAEYLTDVGYVHLNLKDWPEARRLLEAARDVRITQGVRMDWRSVATLLYLGHTAKGEQRNMEAVAIYRDVARQGKAIFGSSHPSELMWSASIAKAWAQAGRPLAAIAEIRRCLAEFEFVEGVPAHYRYYLLLNLARFERETGDVHASNEHLSAARLVSSSGPDDDEILMELMRNAGVEGDAMAVQTYHALLAGKELVPALQMTALQEHARALGSLGAWDKAVAELEKAQAMIVDLTGTAEAAASCEFAFELGRAYRELGDHDAAERELGRALAERRALYPVAGPTHALVLHELGELALDRRRWAEARVLFEEAESIYASTAEIDYPPLVRTREALARARASEAHSSLSADQSSTATTTP